MKYSEKWGDSIEAAVNLALQDLKLSREQVTVTVLEEPTRGFFGIGSKLAKVRVEEIVKEEPKPQKPVKEAAKPEKKEAPAKESKEVKEEKKEEAKEEAPSPKKEKKPRNRKPNKEKKAEKTEKPEKEENTKIEIFQHALVSQKPDDLVETEDHPAKEFLDKTFKEMGIEVSVKVAVNKDSVYADVEGKDTGTVIGKRGQTLDAIQYLTSLVVNKGEDEYIRVVVDAENYRAKREATLEKLAVRLAEKVKKTGRYARLEPMNPYERKVIHTTLQGIEGINTRSEGDEPYRRVVIEPKK